MAFSVVTDPVSQPLAAPPSVAPPSILSRLRLETRGEHKAVEQVLDLMSVSLTPKGYRHRLEQFYGFYAVLENALQARGQGKSDPSAESILSPATRSALVARSNKTALLRQDLHCLGADLETLPLCRTLPPLGTQAEVLGCLYVMEGATLGGRMISQHMRAALGITPTTGGSFFDGYGDATGTMWQGMRQLLVSSATDTETENALVASAITTFACLRNWCESFQKQLANGTTRHE